MNANIKTTEKKEIMIGNQKTVMELLEKMKGEISRCLPKHLTPDRMTRIALTELRKNPKLQECDPMSFIASIMQACQLGLEPGILGSCYLVPFFNKNTGRYECTLIPGYRGFLELARRSGQISSLVGRSVYSNDFFSYEFGLEEKLIHRPAMENRGQLISVYAVALLKDGGHQFDVISKADVDLVRNQSQSKNNGPWVTHYEEMAKKTVLRKLFKWLPCSIEMQKAVSLDELADVGRQNIRASASEEFDIDFIEGDVVEEPKKSKSQKLEEKIKSAKGILEVEETGEVVTSQQLEELEALIAVKGFSNGRLEKAMEFYAIETLDQLTQAKADEFIDILKKENDV